MLVMTRQVGPSVVIDDQIIVAVDWFGSDEVQLSLVNARGVPLGRLAVVRDSSESLPRGVKVVIVESLDAKVRLGFTWTGAETRIARKEHWDELHGAD